MSMSESTPVKSGKSNPFQAFGLALLIEAAIVVGAAAVLIGNAAKPALSEPVPITLAEPQPEKPVERPPEPPPPVPQPKQKVLAKVSEPKPQSPPQPVTPPVAQDPSPVAATPTAFTEPAPPAPAPVPPPPVAGKVDAHAAYDAKVKSAVYQWHRANYPPVASTMHFSGRVQVEFHLHDGVVGGVTVKTSCGIGLFDQAAMRAVQNAVYPETPAELRGHDNLYLVWVEFQN